MAMNPAKAAKQRRKELARKSKEASKRRKQMLKESQMTDKAKERKSKKAAQSAGGLKVAIAKAFPTFAGALKVKPADLNLDAQSRPKKEFSGRTPTLNLLPPEYTVDRAVASMRRSFVIAGVGVLGALGVVYFAQGAVTNIATQALTTAQLQSVEATQKVSQYQDVSVLYDSLSDRRTIIDSVEANRPEYYAALTELYALVPSGVSIDQVSIKHVSLLIGSATTESGEEVQPLADICGPPVDPFRQDPRLVSACISFSGTTSTVDGVYALMESYQSSTLFSNIVVTPGGAGKDGLVAFSATGAILAEADVTKILRQSNEELTGEVTFGDGGVGLSETPDPSLTYVDGEFSITDGLDLIDANGIIVATSSEYGIVDDNISYVLYNEQYYLIDEAGRSILREIFGGSPSDGELLEPVNSDDPGVNGYVVDGETNDIIDPFTGELIAANGAWEYLTGSDEYIVLATGQPLKMADIFYAWYEG